MSGAARITLALALVVFSAASAASAASAGAPAAAAQEEKPATAPHAGHEAAAPSDAGHEAAPPSPVGHQAAPSAPAPSSPRAPGDGATSEMANELEVMPEFSGGPISLEELERRTLEHNPEIFQTAAQIRAAEGLRRQVGLLPNPVLGYAAEEVALESGRDSGKQGAFVRQTLVIGGKLRRNREIFDRETERARAVHELARLRELNRVRILYYRSSAAQRRVELRGRLAALASESAAVTRQLFNTGVADLPDQLAIEIEAELAELDLAAARRDLRQLWQELRSAVGDPQLVPGRLEDTLETEIPVLASDEVLGRILADSPETRFAEIGLERAELALRREKAEPVPNVEITAGVFDNREPLAPGGPAFGNELFGDVGIRIPLFDRNQGNIDAAKAEIERADAERRRARFKIEARFAPIFATYQQELDTVTRYRERILGRAEQAYRLQMERYRQMAAAYPQVLVSQRTLFQAEETYVASLGRLWESVVLLRGMLLSEESSPQILDDAVLRRTPIELVSPE